MDVNEHEGGGLSKLRLGRVASGIEERSWSKSLTPSLIIKISQTINFGRAALRPLKPYPRDQLLEENERTPQERL